METGRLERRSSERFRVELKGLITFDDDSRFVECTMWDLSTTGARLVLHDPAEIPLEFELQIPEKGASAQVRLVWATGKECGVVFID